MSTSNYISEITFSDIPMLNLNDNQYDIEIYTQSVPEPPCIAMRWRFIVQAQFFTHFGYRLYIPKSDQATEPIDITS